MQTVAELFDTLGRETITNRLGHKPQVLSRAAVDGVMPSGWYTGIRDLCHESGKPCPEHLFRWTPIRRGEDAA